MSKSAKNHDRDGLATDALRAIFPSRWLYKNPMDTFSRREYGEDWIIEIVDESDIVTGIEFSVQNKTDIKIKNKFASLNLEVSDLEHLVNNISRPVLLHAFDIKSKNSYWIWIKEWYTQNYELRWKHQKTVTVRIPLTQRLNMETVQHIEATLRHWHHTNKIRDVADMMNRNSLDYAVNIQTIGNSVTTTINPKHQQAIPRFTPLDDHAREAIKTMLEEGIPVPVSGKFSLEFLPNPLMDLMPKEIENAVIFPIIQHETFPIKVECVDVGGKTTFKLPFAIMHLIRSGTVIKQWVGESGDKFIKYTMTLDAKNKKNTFNLQVAKPENTAIALSRYIEAIEHIKASKQIKMVILNNDAEVYFDVPDILVENLTLLQRASRDLVKSLAVIESKLNIRISIPDEIDDQMVNDALYIKDALLEGIVTLDADKFIPPDHFLIGQETVLKAKKLLDAFKAEGKVDVFLIKTYDVKMDLLGNQVDLGPARYEFPNSKILNEQEIEQHYSESSDNEKMINIVFEIDRKQLCLKFLNWYNVN